MNAAILVFGVLLISQERTATDLRNSGSSVSIENSTEANSNREPVDTGKMTRVVDSKIDDLEHSAAFRKSAEDAWHATQNGATAFETGFAIDKDGHPGKLQSSIFAHYDDPAHHLKIVFSADSLALFHVHTKFGEPGPSPGDIQAARTKHKMVYVASRMGLYCVDPHGSIRHVFDDVYWFRKKQ